MRHLFFFSVVLFGLHTTALSQLGIHWDDDAGFGLHYRSHPSTTWSYDGALQFGLGSSIQGQRFWNLSAEVGARYHFYRKGKVSTNVGLRAATRLFQNPTEQFIPISSENRYPLVYENVRVGGSLVLPLGISILVGERNQWEIFLESGLEYNFNQNRLFHQNIFPHARVGLTYYFRR